MREVFGLVFSFSFQQILQSNSSILFFVPYWPIFAFLPFFSISSQVAFSKRWIFASASHTRALAYKIHIQIVQFPLNFTSQSSILACSNSFSRSLISDVDPPVVSIAIPSSCSPLEVEEFVFKSASSWDALRFVPPPFWRVIGSSVPPLVLIDDNCELWRLPGGGVKFNGLNCSSERCWRGSEIRLLRRDGTVKRWKLCILRRYQIQTSSTPNQCSHWHCVDRRWILLVGGHHLRWLFGISSGRCSFVLLWTFFDDIHIFHRCLTDEGINKFLQFSCIWLPMIGLKWLGNCIEMFGWANQPELCTSYLANMICANIHNPFPKNYFFNFDKNFLKIYLCPFMVQSFLALIENILPNLLFLLSILANQHCIIVSNHFGQLELFHCLN